MLFRTSALGCFSLLLLLANGDAGEPALRAAPKKEVDHWAFRSPQRPNIPAVKNSGWVQSPVDAFILARLERDVLEPAPPADKLRLLRRVYLDLIGLPPTPEDQTAFLADRSPQAYARVVDNLLSRPQYGERWARHWLDVVRYAESNGYERDGAKPHAWRYRDYVIDSFNKDKPYDRFLTEQIAGDEIEGANAETQIATTFLRLGTFDDEPADPLVDRYDQLDDVLGTTATAFLSLTLRCARCHDHKFEPFSQKDYYGMLSVFEPLKRPLREREDLDKLVGTERELAAYEKALAKPAGKIAELQRRIEQLDLQIRDRLFAAVPEAKAEKKAILAFLSTEVIAAFKTDLAKRTAAQKEIVKKLSKQLEDLILQASTPPEKAQREALKKEIAATNLQKPKEPLRAYIWDEPSSAASATRIFRRGDPTKPDAEVGPTLPVVLSSKPSNAPRPTRKSTGRRTWLANWMTRPDNPLAARVMVNRVWQHHFGEGLVPTENDFGVNGQAPSYPELLDWLSVEFVERGWRLKDLHRSLVLSSTYQMASSANAKANEADGDGNLIYRWRQRRLEAEAVRDAILHVSGSLNSSMAGPSVYPVLPRPVLEGQSRPGDGWGKSDSKESSKRSVYIFVKRSLAVPELDLLDTPDTTSSCEQRPVSTTGPQALTFLNGDFVQHEARQFAERLRREAGESREAQIRLAFDLALCRPPASAEIKWASEFLSRQSVQIQNDAANTKSSPGGAARKALEAFCLVMLNTNEFVYHN